MTKTKSGLTLERYLWINDQAKELMTKYGLTQQGWSFKISSHKTFIGTCEHRYKRITYSKYYTSSPDEEIIDTLLHEIAHALVGAQHGHDRIWQAAAIEIGARPVRCAQPDLIVNTARPNYVIKCPNCNRQWKRYRLRRSLIGGTCPDCGVTVEIYKIRHKDELTEDGDLNGGSTF